MLFATRICVMVLAIVLSYAGLPAKAKGTFHVAPAIENAYDLVFQLRLDEAARTIEGFKSASPDNLMTYYVQDFIDFFSVLISDDLDQYQAIKTARDARLRLLSLGDPSSPYYLYIPAEIYIHRAILRMKFGENFGAASDLNQAFRLLKRNERRFPDFAPNFKSLGMLKAAFGTIPDHYRWAIELLSSMEGTVAGGMDDLRASLNDDHHLVLRETQFCYILALFYFQNDPDAALDYAIKNGILANSGLLESFILGHIALKSGKNDLAIKWLSFRPPGTSPYALPHLDLMYGTAKLQRLDEDAYKPLLRFLETYKGKNYIKEAYHKLAWHDLIHGSVEGYKRYMELCRKNGCELNESDRYAMAEASRNHAPHTWLLKARLLFDGGYHLQALEIIETLSFDHLSAIEQVEYRYRSGRIYYEMGREYDALFAFKMAISSGSTSREYFACAAALHAGILYENKGEIENADMYYRICLNVHPDEYKAGLHQRAKAGLSRIKSVTISHR